MLTEGSQLDDSTVSCFAPADPPFIYEAVNQKVTQTSEQHIIHSAVVNTSKKPAVVEMQSNDYLSIANDRRISKAKAEHLLAYGHGDAISRIFAHDRNDVHRNFEKRIARLTRAEDAVLVMSGYNANTGIVQAFAQKNTPVYIDIRAHASLWEGIVCARAKARPFRHNQPDDLLKKIRKFGPGLVIVDSLYSTNGNICPLAEIVDVANNQGCAIIIDETHAFGCHGPEGAGLVVELGLEDRVHFRTVGLSKAMAARGGAVIGSRKNMEHFRYEAWPMIFSTSVLEYEVVGFDKTLDIISEEPWRRDKLHKNHHFLKAGLLALGYDVTESDSQIISLVTGCLENTIKFRKFLEKYGVIGSVFCPPATPENKSLMRFTVNAALNERSLKYTLEVCAKALRKLEMNSWPCFKS